MKKYLLLLLCMVCLQTQPKAQVGISATNSPPNASAMLDVSSTTKGFLAPRMTTAQRLAIAPAAAGLLVFDTNTKSYWYCSFIYFLGGTAYSNWSEIPNKPIWELNGLAGTEISNTNTGGFWSKNAVGLNPYSDDTSNPPTAPVSGAGTRMMWIPSRSAFRVGTTDYVYPTQWDAPNIGLYSFASGLDTKASGQSATATGGYTTASHSYTTAMGVLTTASGFGSTAIGWSSLASGNYSIAMGGKSIASGLQSTAMGYKTNAFGKNSTAMGDSTKASGDASNAMGFHTTASSNFSTAMGSYTTASGINSTAMGNSTTANGESSTTMGYSTTASGNYSTALGRNSIASGESSTTMGYYTNASGTSSVAMGYYTNASGIHSISMGDNSIASGDFSTALGYYTKANGHASTVFGYSSTASGIYSTAMGNNANTNSKAYSFAISGSSITSRAINDKSYQMKMHFDEYKFLTGTANDVTITDGQITTSNTLSVFGVANNTISNYGYLGAISNAPAGFYTGSTTIPYSIYSVSRILALEFDAFSDARHKKLSSYSNGKTDLSLLNQLKVSNYTFIDTVGKGTKMQMGFIAQQVETIVPEAVNRIQDYIPSVYDMAKSMVYNANAHTLKVTTHKPHDFQAKDEIKLISLDKEYKVKVDEIIDANTFIVNNWEKPVDKIFVFGKRVDDFRTVDYDRLFTLGISSIQELSRRVEQLEKENGILKSENKEFKQMKNEIAELRAMIVK